MMILDERPNNQKIVLDSKEIQKSTWFEVPVLEITVKIRGAICEIVGLSQTSTALVGVFTKDQMFVRATQTSDRYEEFYHFIRDPESPNENLWNGTRTFFIAGSDVDSKRKQQLKMHLGKDLLSKTRST